jgi:hypothetical protein
LKRVRTLEVTSILSEMKGSTVHNRVLFGWALCRSLAAAPVLRVARVSRPAVPRTSTSALLLCDHPLIGAFPRQNSIRQTGFQYRRGGNL